MSQSEYSSVSASTYSTRSGHSSSGGESSNGSTRLSRASHYPPRSNIRSTNLVLPKGRKALACIVWFAGGSPGAVKHIRRDDFVHPPYAEPQFHFVKSRRPKSQTGSLAGTASHGGGPPPNIAPMQTAPDGPGGYASDHVDADADAMPGSRPR